MAGLVLNSTAVILLNFCAKPNICPSISATSPSCKTLADTTKDTTLKKIQQIKSIKNEENINNFQAHLAGA